MSKRDRKHAMLALLVLLLGTATAVGFGVRQKIHNAHVVDAQLDVLSQRAVEDLQDRLLRYESGLRGLRGAIVVAGDAGISRKWFLRYAESRDIGREFSGANGFGFIARVPAARKTAFAARVRRDDSPGFAIHELSTRSGDAFVIQYIEPLLDNRMALGLDIASEPHSRKAAMDAMLSGSAVLTAPVTLAQMTGTPRRSLLFLLPVYQGSQQQQPSTREAACVGWVYAPLLIDAVLADFQRTHTDSNLALNDVTEAGQVEQVFGSVETDGPTRSQVFAVYGRQWRMQTTARPGFVAGLALTSPWVVVAGILAMTALLAGLLFALFKVRGRQRAVSGQRARTAAIVESLPDAIIGTTVEGRVTEWNRSAAQMFGYTEADALGRTLVELIVPLSLVREDHAILGRLQRDEDVDTLETVRRHRDGSELEVEVATSAIRDSRNRITGLATTVRDIAERKQIRQTIERVNVRLQQQAQTHSNELQAHSTLHRAMVADAGYAIIATDPTGTITMFNPAAEAMLGYAADEVVGVTHPGNFHDQLEMAERAHDLQSELGRTIEPGFEVFVAKAREEPDVNEWSWITKSGEHIPVLLSVSTLRNDDGELFGYLGIAVDLRERKVREVALETNEHRLRSLFEHSPVAIVLTDEDGRFVEFNHTFQSLTGYSRNELTELDESRLTPSEFESRELAVRVTLAQTGRYGPYEKQYRRKDGSRVPVRLNGVGLQLDAKPHTWSVVEDISVQRDSEAEMIDAVAAVEAISQAKSDLVARANPEIHASMSAILEMLQLLQRTGLDARQQDYARKTETVSRALLAILDDAMDFSRIESEARATETEQFDIQGVLRRISGALGANTGDKNVEVVFDIDSRVPDWLLGDASRLQHVLLNLASNAIKFTDAGEVVVAIEVQELSDSRVKLGFEVRDTGIGIDPARLESLLESNFEGPARGGSKVTRRIAALGLGLAVSQRLVRLMGGELEAESERGRGSRFRFAIQFDLSANPPDISPALSGARLQDLRVLVVDDNAYAREVVVEMVRALGWSADAVASGEIAVKRITQLIERKGNYDVVLLDWRMPAVGGWETCKQIRELCPHPATSIIAMVTAHGREILARGSASERAMLDGFLTKPITRNLLFDAVADAGIATATIAPRRSATIGGGVASPWRLAAMSILALEDNIANQRVLAELLGFEGAHVALASSGSQALQMLARQNAGYDAVLMDVRLPDMDGTTVARRIRAMPWRKSLPIIAMSTTVLVSDREDCAQAGMNDLVEKPLELDVLVERLLHVTGRVMQRKPTPVIARAEPNSAPPPAEKSVVNSLDWATALARLAGNRRTYAANLMRFPATAAEIIIMLEHSLQAGERIAVCDQLGNLRDVATALGATRVAALAVAQEDAIRNWEAPDWAEAISIEDLHDAIDEVVAVSRAAFRAIAADMPATPEIKPVPPASRRRLEELGSLLDGSNLRALEVFESVSAQLAATHPDQHGQIHAALKRFDFSMASAACNELLHKAEASS